jgi:hypothetical protein
MYEWRHESLTDERTNFDLTPPQQLRICIYDKHILSNLTKSYHKSCPNAA